MSGDVASMRGPMTPAEAENLVAGAIDELLAAVTGSATCGGALILRARIAASARWVDNMVSNARICALHEAANTRDLTPSEHEMLAARVANVERSRADIDRICVAFIGLTLAQLGEVR